MKASELRIGNYVCARDPGKIFVTCNDPDERIDVDVVTEIMDNQIGLFNDGNYNSSSYCQYFKPEDVKPISLTEEWLVKFGFDKRNDAIFHSRNLLLEYKSGWWFGVNHSLVVWIAGIDFVHQLQNLFFALTGEELEVKV